MSHVGRHLEYRALVVVMYTFTFYKLKLASPRKYKA